MKKRSIFAMAVILGLLAVIAGARTFTNTAGKQVEAELMAVDEEVAVLKLANGRSAKVPLASLSEEDQTYAKAWYEENKNKISERDLRLSIVKKTERTKQDSGGGKGGKNTNKGDTTETTYKCTLENLSSKSIEGIVANYTIHKRTSKRDESGSETFNEEVDGSAEVPKVESRKSAEFELGPAVCVDFEKSSNKGAGSSQREKILGVVVTLMNGEQEILKQSDPKNLLDRLEEEAERQKARERGRE